MIVTGGCRCAAVRYELTVTSPLHAYACHCLDCQTWTGSAFSEQIVAADDMFAVSGETGLYEMRSSSGRISHQRYCPICQTRVFNTNSARPGTVIVRAGTLDASHELNVVAHIWTRRMQPWLVLADHVPRWAESAPFADLALALGALDTFDSRTT